jgi:heme/copper-type cytochrome/quinol oxidase subunit 1
VHDELASSWDPGRGLAAWLGEVRHTRIGLRFIATAFAFFIAGGIEAAMMRLQLARADSHLIDPDLYNACSPRTGAR